MDASRIAPWLTVDDGERAAAFYRQALGATEMYRLEGDDGRAVVVQLRIGDAELWIQEEEAGPEPSPDIPRPIRLILSVEDPDASFARAVGAGATEVAVVHDEHGWRTGRVTDPFGHDWEFSTEIDDAPAD